MSAHADDCPFCVEVLAEHDRPPKRLRVWPDGHLASGGARVRAPRRLKPFEVGVRVVDQSPRPPLLLVEMPSGARYYALDEADAVKVSKSWLSKAYGLRPESVEVNVNRV